MRDMIQKSKYVAYLKKGRENRGRADERFSIVYPIEPKNEHQHKEQPKDELY